MAEVKYGNETYNTSTGTWTNVYTGATRTTPGYVPASPSGTFTPPPASGSASQGLGNQWLPGFIPGQPSGQAGGGGGAATIQQQQASVEKVVSEQFPEKKNLTYSEAVSKYNAGDRSSAVIDVIENSRMGMSRKEYDEATKKFKEERDIIGTGAYIAASRGITVERQLQIRQNTGIGVPDYVPGYGIEKYWKDIDEYTATAKAMFPSVMTFKEQLAAIDKVTAERAQSSSAVMSANLRAPAPEKVSYRLATKEDIAGGRAVGIEDPSRGMSLLGVIMSPEDVRKYEKQQYEEQLVLQAQRMQGYYAGLPKDSTLIFKKGPEDKEWTVRAVPYGPQKLLPEEGMGSIGYGGSLGAAYSVMSLNIFGPQGRPDNTFFGKEQLRGLGNLFVGGAFTLGDIGIETGKTYGKLIQVSTSPQELGARVEYMKQNKISPTQLGTGWILPAALMTGAGLYAPISAAERSLKGDPVAQGELLGFGLMFGGPEIIGKAGKTAARPIELYNAFAEGKAMELKFTPIERINWAGETEFYGTRSIQFQKAGYGLDIIRVNDKSLTSPRAIFDIRGLAPKEETALVKAKIPEFMGRNLETAELRPYKLPSYSVEQGVSRPVTLTEFYGKLPTPFDVTEGAPYKAQAEAEAYFYGYGKKGIERVRAEGILDYEAQRALTPQDLTEIRPDQALVRSGEKEILAGGIYRKGENVGIEFERLWSSESSGQPFDMVLSGTGVFKGKFLKAPRTPFSELDFIQVVIREKAYETERVRSMTSPKLFQYKEGQKINLVFGERMNLGPEEFKKTPLIFEKQAQKGAPGPNVEEILGKGGDVTTLSKTEMKAPRILKEFESAQESYDVLSKMRDEMFQKEQQKLFENPRYSEMMGALDIGKILSGVGVISKTQPRTAHIFGEGKALELTIEQPRVKDMIGSGVIDVFKGITGPSEIELNLPRMTEFVGVRDLVGEFQGQQMRQIQIYDFEIPRPGETGGGIGPPGPEPPRIEIPRPSIFFPLGGAAKGNPYEKQARHLLKEVYNPSLLAFELDIESTSTPAMTFGIEPRPIIVKKSRRRRKR